MNKFLNILQGICYILIIIGALNWGLVGTMNFNLVEYFFNQGVVTRTLYIIIGVAAIISIILTAKYTMDNREY